MSDLWLVRLLNQDTRAGALRVHLRLVQLLREARDRRRVLRVGYLCENQIGVTNGKHLSSDAHARALAAGVFCSVIKPQTAFICPSQVNLKQLASRAVMQYTKDPALGRSR